MDKRSNIFLRFEEREQRVKSKFVKKNKYQRNASYEKLVKIKSLVSKYSYLPTPLVQKKASGLHLKKIPLSNPGRTKSCILTDLEQNTRKQKLSINDVKLNIRYLRQDFEEDEGKNKIETPEDSWKSIKNKFGSYFEIRPVEGKIGQSKSSFNLDLSTRYTEDTIRNQKTTSRTKRKNSRISSVLSINHK